MCMISFPSADVLQMSCTCRHCRHVMTVPQIVSKQMHRYILAETDKLMVEPQSDHAYLDRILIPSTQISNSSVVMLRDM